MNFSILCEIVISSGVKSREIRSNDHLVLSFLSTAKVTTNMLFHFSLSFDYISLLYTSL